MPKWNLIDTVPAHGTQRSLTHHEIEGELLPALPEDVRPPMLPPMIQLHLLPMRQEDEAVAYETRKAQRAVTWESDVKVPAAQAFLTACAFGVMTALLAWAAGWSWRVPVIVFAVILALAWLWRLRLADALLWQIETIVQRDLDGDRQVGRPTVNAAPVLVNPSEARAAAGRIQKTNEAQAELVDLLAFVTKCANVGTSESAQGIPPAPAARAAFARKRDILIDLGVAAWRDPERRRLGWQLTMTPAQATPLLRRHVMGRDHAN